MRIYLIQHGRAKSKEEDPQRRLTDQGISEVQKVADFLRSLGLGANTVWHSGKARAQQTAELIAEAVSAHVVQRDGLGPKDEVAPTKQALERTIGDVMIVSHLPFLGKLAALLIIGSEANEIVEFQFGGVVCLESLDKGKWKIAWMITPALLHR